MNNDLNGIYPDRTLEKFDLNDLLFERKTKSFKKNNEKNYLENVKFSKKKNLYKSDLMTANKREDIFSKNKSSKKTKSVKRKRKKKNINVDIDLKKKKKSKKYRIKRTYLVRKNKKSTAKKQPKKVEEFTFTPKKLKESLEELKVKKLKTKKVTKKRQSKKEKKKESKSKSNIKNKKSINEKEERESLIKKKLQDSILTQFINNVKDPVIKNKSIDKKNIVIKSSKKQLKHSSLKNSKITGDKANIFLNSGEQNKSIETNQLNTNDAQLSSSRPLLSTLTQSQQQELQEREALIEIIKQTPDNQTLEIPSTTLAKLSNKANKDPNSLSISKDITVSKESSFIDSKNISLKKEELLQILLSKHSKPSSQGESLEPYQLESKVIKQIKTGIRRIQEEEESETSIHPPKLPSYRHIIEEEKNMFQENETSFQNLEMNEESQLDKEIAQLEELERKESCLELNHQIKKKIISSFGFMDNGQSFVNFDNDRIQSLIQQHRSSVERDFIDKSNENLNGSKEKDNVFQGSGREFKTFAESKVVSSLEQTLPESSNERGYFVNTEGEVKFLKQINESSKRDMGNNNS